MYCKGNYQLKKLNFYSAQNYFIELKQANPAAINQRKLLG